MTFVVVQSEMDNLKSRLTSVADNLNNMRGSALSALPGLPIVGGAISAGLLGSATLSAAVNDFMSDANKRRNGSKEWCKKNAEGVEFTARHAQDTEDEVAAAWNKQNPSFLGGSLIIGRMFQNGGNFPWEVAFPHDDDTYQ